MKINAINWFEIYTADLDRSRAFYETILQANLVDAGPGDLRMAIFPYDNMQGTGGALVKMDGCNPGPGGTLVYLNVEGELDAVISRIPGAGGNLIRERMAIPPHGFIAIFRDPEGNVLGLHSMV